MQSRFRRAVSTIGIVFGIVFGGCFVADFAFGQTDAEVTTKQTPSTGSSVKELQKNYDVAIEELRVALKTIKRTGADYYQNKSTVAYEYREKWEAEAVVAENAYKKVREAAFALFFNLKNPDTELMQVIQLMSQKLIAQGQLTTCYDVTQKLLDLNPGDPELTKMMGQISILTNDFDFARKFYQTQKSEIDSFGMAEKGLYNSIETLGTRFKRELELRESDAQGEELPRAIVKTTKGTFVIELFENQAPDTVGNFVNLVESGFYDSIIFHRVLRNILADTGRWTMDRAQPVGYTIYDESKRPDARHHFRGSVSMVLNHDEENSGAAEFRIMLVPGPNLDGRNTVFGRVISGLSVLDSIQETYTIDEEERTEEFIADVTPDMIESITVERLRKHEYEPNRVKD
jgi:cyclophilin family peptidyl-prolyl cis-trans isomerase